MSKKNTELFGNLKKIKEFGFTIKDTLGHIESLFPNDENNYQGILEEDLKIIGDEFTKIILLDNAINKILNDIKILSLNIEISDKKVSVRDEVYIDFAGKLKEISVLITNSTGTMEDETKIAIQSIDNILLVIAAVENKYVSKEDSEKQNQKVLTINNNKEEIV